MLRLLFNVYLGTVAVQGIDSALLRHFGTHQLFVLGKTLIEILIWQVCQGGKDTLLYLILPVLAVWCCFSLKWCDTLVSQDDWQLSWSGDVHVRNVQHFTLGLLCKFSLQWWRDGLWLQSLRISGCTRLCWVISRARLNFSALLRPYRLYSHSLSRDPHCL